MSRSLVAFAVLVAVGGFAPFLEGGQVSVYTLEGARIVGEITGCSDSTLAIATSTGTVTQSFSDLDRVEFLTEQDTPSPPPSNNGTVVATLVDGSSIFCKQFEGRDDRWTATTPSGEALEFGKGALESLRMGGASAAMTREWLDVLKDARTSDEMVIARKEDSIDRASGMIIAVTPEIVEFSFDGQILQAPRAKLLGLLWYRAQERRVEPAIQVKMVDGSRWEANTISLNESKNGLQWKTSCGVEARALWSEIQEINFSAANVVWLASLEPLSTKTFQRPILKESIAGRDSLLGPRFFSANGSDDSKFQDLNFVGPSEIDFRVPLGFQRFVAKVRRFEKTRFATTLRCEVWVGDDLAWTTTLAHDQIEATVDIPVVPEKRLKIVVVCDSDLLLGTQLSWQQPRLIR
jgi:hypothetical protein